MPGSGLLTNIGFKSLAVGGVDFVAFNAHNGAGGEIAVGFEKGFEVALPRRDAATAQRPFGDQHVAQPSVVLESFTHLLFRNAHRPMVGIGILDELFSRGQRQRKAYSYSRAT